MIGQHAVTVGGLDVSCLVDAVSIQHGREDATGQPEASSATIEMDLTDTTLPTEVEIGAAVLVTTTWAGITYTRFSGVVTDVALEWDDAGWDTPNAGLGQVIAVGTLANLGRRVVGDTPFPQELDGARVSRVLALAGVTLDPAYSDPGTVQIIARDVDSQPALDVAAGTADSAGGLVWQTRAGEIRYADANHRRNLTPDVLFDSCQVLVTPKWTRDLGGLVNSVSIGYGVTPDEGEQPRVETTNAGSIAKYGTYDYTTATELAAAADATAMAELLVTRGGRPAWIMSDLPMDVKGLDDAQTAKLLSLDMHSLIQLTAMPVIAAGTGTDVNLWVEGWTERLAWGEHEITLAVSGFCRTVPPPRWNDVPASVTWDTVQPAAMTWDDAACMGPPVVTGTWDSQPASLRWDMVPPAETWDTFTG